MKKKTFQTFGDEKKRLPTNLVTHYEQDRPAD